METEDMISIYSEIMSYRGSICIWAKYSPF